MIAAQLVCGDSIISGVEFRAKQACWSCLVSEGNELSGGIHNALQCTCDISLWLIS